jgi:hypothetical protein
MIKNGMRPVHPGEILREELHACGLSARGLAEALAVAEPDYRNRPRSARHHCRHRAPPITLFGDNPATVVESAKSL